MPNRTLLICLGIGLAIVAAVVGSGVLVNQKTRLQLNGEVRKTRIAALSPTRSVAILDFRATNPSTFLFVVKSVEIEVTLADGKRETGQFIPEVDAKTLFPAIPELGAKLTDSIAIAEKIAPAQTVERMAAASFSIPEADLAANKGIVLRIRDVDGPVAELR